ncbi:MAG: hypothetical protein ACM3NQ_10985 [Bacteroidales bacterium]
MKNVRWALVAVAFVVTTVFAADPPYIGKWKINQAKSNLAGSTVTIASGANGMMSFESQGFAYTFKTDGKEYPTPDGGTTVWKETSPTVWDVTNKLNGKVVSMIHLELKDDNLAVGVKVAKPDGGMMDYTAAYKRVSGGPGFQGKWVSTEVKMPMATLEITANGANGIAMKDDTGPIASGQFDGKDNPALGVMAGSKNTVAFKKLGPSSFEVTSKLDGKPMNVDVYSVSADGKTLTIDGTPTNAKAEKYRVVFDKQ